MGLTVNHTNIITGASRQKTHFNTKRGYEGGQTDKQRKLILIRGETLSDNSNTHMRKFRGRRYSAPSAVSSHPPHSPVGTTATRHPVYSQMSSSLRALLFNKPLHSITFQRGCQLLEWIKITQSQAYKRAHCVSALPQALRWKIRLEGGEDSSLQL